MDEKDLRQPAQYADPKLSEGHYATGNPPMDEKEITSREKAWDAALAATKLPSVEDRPITCADVKLYEATGGEMSDASKLEDRSGQVVLPPLVVDGLIKALMERRDKQKETEKGVRNELDKQYVKPTHSIH